MNQYILHTLTDYSIDEERLKVLSHTPCLFKNFYGILEEIKSPKDGGFIFLKPIKDYNWNEGLYGACLGGNVNVVNLMIWKGANDLNLGLSNACYGGNLNTVNLMISKGANHWDKGLYSACDGGHLNVVNLMIEKGATTCYNCEKSIEEHLQAIKDEFSGL